MSSSSIKKLNVAVNGLSPDTTYRYVISNKGGNWPVKVSSLSGIINATSATQTYNISTYVEFCPTTGLCPSGAANILYNSPLSDMKAGVSVDRSNLYTVIGISVYDNNTNNLVLATESIAECDNCLPPLSVTGVSNIKLDSATTNSTILNMTASNLIPNQKYRYKFDVTDANWPLQIHPISGIIQTSSDIYSIKSKLRFCAKEDDCYNAFNHTEIENCDKDQSRFAAIKITVEPETANYQIASSYDFTAVCDNCIKYTTVNIPKTLELTNITKNQASIDLSLSNLIIGKTYRYSINSIDANWPFIASPYSGEITAFDSNITLPIKITTCTSTGVCPSDKDTVLDYTVDATCLSSYGTADKYTRLNVSLVPLDNDSNPNCDSIISNQLLVTCSNCLPKPKVTLPSIVNLNYSSNIKYNGLIDISNLVIGQKYNFSLLANSSNWPTKLYPQSGSFVADGTTTSIPFNISFCSNTGLYPLGAADILPFSLTSDSIKQKNFKTEVIAAIQPQDCSDQETNNSNVMMVVCDECAPKTIVGLAPDINLSSTTQNKGSFNLSLSNLVPGALYTYVLESIDANWPVLASPMSGTIIPSNTSVNIPIDITFCRSTGLCPTNNPKVLDYTLDPLCLVNYNTVDKYVRLQGKVTNVNDPASNSIISNILNIECNDCLPRTKITLPNNIVLTEGMESYTGNAMLSNLIPGQQYKFNFSATNSTWPTRLYPQSGIFVADSNSFSMPFDVTFCRSTGVIIDNILPFTLDTTDNNHSTSVVLSVQPNNCSTIESVDSNISTITCKQCIPSPRVTLPASNVVLTNNIYNITGIMHNLVSGQKYDYTIDTIYSNWPTTVYPQSGTFVADSSSVMNLPLQLTFCRSTGICPQGSKNVLPFSLESSCNYIDGNDIKTTIALSVQSNGSSALSKISSNPMTIGCNNCLPVIRATLPATVSLTSSNSITTTLSILNTIPGREYSYSAIGLGANWPVSVYPASGTVTATGTTIALPIKLSFCRSSGLCPESDASVLPYAIKSSAYYGNNLDRNARFKFMVTDIDCDLSISTNESITTCENCIQATVLNNAVATTSLSSAGNTRYQLTTTAQNLVPGEKYSYNINYVDANWPTVVYPQSGTFIATSTTKTISTDIQFCFPSGSCVGTIATMPYVLNNNISTNKYLKFNMVMDDPTVPNAPIRSEDFTLLCSNCFPSTNYTVSMSGAPNLTFPLSCCTGTRVMKVDVTNAIPGDIHRYEMVSSVPTITFVPDSGRFVVKPNGSGSFFNMMTSTMPSGTSSIVTCRIVNESSNIESTEFMVVRCGTGC